jgi:hypothetical protein
MRVYEFEGDVLLDLSIYDHKGSRIGRQSPAEGGPKSFEPACAAKHWERIKRPSFPIVPRWMPNGDGTASLRMWAGDRLPPANWTPPEPARKPTVKAPDNPPFLSLEEYEHLADLFASANDPVSAKIGAKAAEVVAWLKRLRGSTSPTKTEPQGE